ncbi:MAG: hypothetical protein L7S44_07540 [Flavobacteriaceae bacterium]|nr:hypothetical protein [Flavobacteriaceae bacterium]
MNKLLFFLFMLFFSCSKKNISNQCSFLADIDVFYEINLNLPQYNQLNFISNSIIIPNIGNGGIIITNSGTGFLAWDASDPNHISNPSCSTMSILGGIESLCNCQDENSYSLITGQSLNIALECSLKPYRVELNGNTLLISSF